MQLIWCKYLVNTPLIADHQAHTSQSARHLCYRVVVWCRILDAARMVGNQPVSPKPLISYILAVIIGLFIPYSLVTVKDYLDDSVKSKSYTAEQITIKRLQTELIR